MSRMEFKYGVNECKIKSYKRTVYYSVKLITFWYDFSSPSMGEEGLGCFTQTSTISSLPLFVDLEG
jgi:hypothetical protein